MTAGLYVHIPFCTRICGYCDFFTALNRDASISAYLGSLETEIALRAADSRANELIFDTIYLGGGTPSLLEADQLAALIASLRMQFHFSSKLEITLESNPDGVDLARLEGFRGAGVNRLSLGMQSFHAHELKVLERDHTAEQSIACFKDARKAGFENISIDLIFALPDQEIETWRENLQQAVELCPDHISAYNLTYEKGTPFSLKLKRGHLSQAREETQTAMYLAALDLLTANGFEHYEISNYAQQDFRSRHNQKYWDGNAYLGLGVSAHSFIDHRRFWNVANLNEYRSRLSSGRLPTAGEEILSPEVQSFERVLLGLRRRSGIDLAAFEAESGISFFSQYPGALRKFFGREFEDQTLIEELTTGSRPMTGELLEISAGFLKLTERGLVLSDAICSEFL